MIIQNGLVFEAYGAFSSRDVFVDGNTIAASPRADGVPDEVIDAGGGYVLPGFVDIHTHGAMNYDLCDADPNGIEAILAYHGSQGVTTVVPATMAYPEPVIEKIVRTTLPYFNKDGYGAVLRGINLEGPFISLQKRGAQNPDNLVNPDLDFFNRMFALSEKHILLVDLAPELPGALKFIQEISEKCVVSLAHTDATYDEAIAAFEAGASHVTHLFNGMPPLNHREPGVIGAAADKATFVEIISDGFHLHPAIVRSAFRMFGADRVCLISDSMRATGMPDGEYDLGGQRVNVSNGKATLTGGNFSIAGSAVNLADMCRRAIGFGVPIEHAVRAATLNPARAVGLDGKIGTIEVGKRADLVIWDSELRTKEVICAGKRIS